MEYFSLIVTDQDKMILQMIRQFVDKEIMPIRDKLDDDTEHLIINEILGKLSNLGVFSVAARDESAGEDAAGPSLVTSCVVLEEMSRGDAGIAVVAAVNGWALAPAASSGNKEVLDLFASMSAEKTPCLGCFSMTEPAGGCDIENLPALHGRTIKTRAVLDGGARRPRSVWRRPGVADHRNRWLRDWLCFNQYQWIARLRIPGVSQGLHGIS